MRLSAAAALIWINAIGGHLALAVFVTNGARVSSMEQTIARIASASYDFFSGKQLRPPAARARGAVERRTIEKKATAG